MQALSPSEAELDRLHERASAWLEIVRIFLKHGADCHCRRVYNVADDRFPFHRDEGPHDQPSTLLTYWSTLICMSRSLGDGDGQGGLGLKRTESATAGIPPKDPQVI